MREASRAKEVYVRVISDRERLFWLFGIGIRVRGIYTTMRGHGPPGIAWTILTVLASLAYLSRKVQVGLAFFAIALYENISTVIR